MHSARHIFRRSIILLLLPAILYSAPWDNLEESEIRGHKMYTVFEPGDVSAIFDPKFIPVSEADEYYHQDEPLIVVTEGDRARAYGTWHLEEHLVVNDLFGGRMITVTW